MWINCKKKKHAVKPYNTRRKMKNMNTAVREHAAERQFHIKPMKSSYGSFLWKLEQLFLLLSGYCPSQDKSLQAVICCIHSFNIYRFFNPRKPNQIKSNKNKKWPPSIILTLFTIFLFCFTINKKSHKTLKITTNINNNNLTN